MVGKGACSGRMCWVRGAFGASKKEMARYLGLSVGERAEMETGVGATSMGKAVVGGTVHPGRAAETQEENQGSELP